MALYNKEFDDKKLREYIRKVYRDQSGSINIDADFLDGQTPSRDRTELLSETDSVTDVDAFIQKPKILEVKTSKDLIKFLKPTPFVPKIRGLRLTSIDWRVQENGSTDWRYHSSEHPDDLEGALTFCLKYGGGFNYTSLSEGKINVRYRCGDIVSDWSDDYAVNGADHDDGNFVTHIANQKTYFIDGIGFYMAGITGEYSTGYGIEYFVTDINNNIIIDKKPHTPLQSGGDIFIPKEELDEGDYILWWRKRVVDDYFTIWRKIPFYTPGKAFSQVTIMMAPGSNYEKEYYRPTVGFFKEDDFIVTGGTETRYSGGPTYTQAYHGYLGTQTGDDLAGTRMVASSTDMLDEHVPTAGSCSPYYRKDGQPGFGDYTYFGKKTIFVATGSATLSSTQTYITPYLMEFNDPAANVTIKNVTGTSGLLEYDNSFITNIPGTDYFVRLFGITTTQEGASGGSFKISSTATLFRVDATNASPNFIVNTNLVNKQLLENGLYRHAGCLISSNKILITGGYSYYDYTISSSYLEKRIWFSDKTYIVDVKTSLNSTTKDWDADDLAIQEVATLPYRMAWHDMVYLGGTEVLLIGGIAGDDSQYENTYGHNTRALGDIIRFNFMTGESKIVGRLKTARFSHRAIGLVRREDGSTCQAPFGNRPTEILIVGGYTPNNQSDGSFVEIMKWV